MPLQSANVPEILTLQTWGVNQSVGRTTIDDTETWWCENFFPNAPGYLRAGYGPSAPIYTAPSGVQILRMFLGNITLVNPSAFLFLSNGEVHRVDLTTGADVNLGNIWLPISPPIWPADFKIWIPSQIGNVPGEVGIALIGSPAGLYAVDGNDTVTAPGAEAPLQLTNNAPGVPMPQGLPGVYAMEVYQQRLWVSGNSVVSFSAPNNAVDFSTAAGGGSFPYFGDKLTSSYTDMAQGGGFLYLFGDSMVDTISGLNLIGSAGAPGTSLPYTTTFQLQNVDPQNGQRFYRPVGQLGQTFLTYTGDGIRALSGGQVQWISQKMTNLLNTIDASEFQPTICAADIFGKRWMLFNAKLTDPWGVARSMMLCWDGAVWVIATQNLNLTNIGAWEGYSTIHPYGTDGTSLYNLFAQPDPNLEKRISTKAWFGTYLNTIKDFKRLYVEIQDNQHGPEGVSLTGQFSTIGGSIPNGREDVAFDLVPGGYTTVPAPLFGKGLNGMLDLKSLSPDFALTRLSVTYEDRTLYGG